MNKIELLAPAGDLEKLKWAIMYGADAVYLGGKKFSLRANATNFTIDEIKEGVKFADLPEDWKCPTCKAPKSKFVPVEEEGLSWAAEHVIGVAKDVPEDIKADLRANFEGECSEVGMYLAMSRAAFREGYPEVGLYYEKAAYEEAEHAAKFA